MRYPQFLQDGGRIGFIAPSFGCTIEPYSTLFDNALDTFKEKGYETVQGPNCRACDGIGKSTTPERCGAEVNDFFTNDRSDIIISCGGGETMCEDLPYIDFEAIAESKPKWYIGYSDNTNLTFTLPTLCDTAAIYGPCASAFGQKTWHKSVGDAFDILTGRKLSVSNYDKWELHDREIPEGEEPDPFEPWNLTEDFNMKVYVPEKDGVENPEAGAACDNGGLVSGNSAKFSGRLLGGCMDILTILCGTEFDKVKEFNERYAGDGVIWFLEACELTPLSIRRTLWQLDNAGWFKNAKGFLFGRPMMFDADGMGLDRYTAVTGILGKYNVPILMDLDIGHLAPQMPLISGAYADVSAEGNSLNIDMKLI
ncbi:MAG: LD-carboxypeptidase [Eubacteriales bacterium]|nr:LD-carboxypeptidase [Eubacteriales bacterium]